MKFYFLLLAMVLSANVILSFNNADVAQDNHEKIMAMIQNNANEHLNMDITHAELAARVTALEERCRR